ncbi:hypothetical protein O181_065993 [Austropuccinia psidii MF-1]|uniref:Uncharacterized protein n=1 Tax=Austropuccinia psidii MF-1 TaxID=1389203 RepID=A0A9Q3EQM2_9BASI|nr:hypothetical protein [Austropuccinia psidii MF-1]
MDNIRFNLASHWKELGASFQRTCLNEISFTNLMVITIGWNSNRKFKLLEEEGARIRKDQATTQAIEGKLNWKEHTLIPSGSQGVEQPNSPVASYHSGGHSSVAKNNHSSQSQAEIVRPNDPEAVGIGERSTQKPEIAVRTSRISIPTNKNITPAQNEHNAVTPESNLNSDQLWLQMSQFAMKNKEKIDELHRRNERVKELTNLHEYTLKAIEKSCARLWKDSEETNKRPNQIFVEQYQCKRYGDCMRQYIKELRNVCQNMKPQPKGHALVNPYQEDIKSDFLLDNNPRSPSQYHDGDKMTY